MIISICIHKSDLDYQLISLSKQKEDYEKLLNYYGKDNEEIIELKHYVYDKLTRIIVLYSLL